MASAAPSASPYLQWQYVAKDQYSIWSAPLAMQHLYAPYATGSPNTAQQPFAVDPDAENFVLIVTGSTAPTPNPARPFAELTFLTPCLRESDHPNGTGGMNNEGADNGPEWIGYMVNSIESSPYWPNTAIIITWDDWGGFYDNYTPSPWPYHPTPPPSPYNNPKDPNEWGFRVPLIVISPWVKSKGYISSKLRSQGAILNFIEASFGLPSLGGDDQSNGTDDLSDMFSFSPVRPTLPPASPLPAMSPLNNASCPPHP